MENTKINVDDYVEYGLGDIYYGLISFIGSYTHSNFNPFEVDENGKSKYAFAFTKMKADLKEILDVLKDLGGAYLPKLKRNVSLSTLTSEEQIALEERCKELLLLKLNYALENEFNNQDTMKR